MIVLTLALLAAAPAPQCSTCHRAQALTQAKTPMAHALEDVAGCAILKTYPHLTYKRGKYAYTIRRQGDASLYSVTDGTDTISAPLAWVFGNGAAGQTYIFERSGALYETRVSFYNAINGLDLTMGAENAEPAGLEEAAGRKMDPANARECFGCHATNAVKDNTLALETLLPGVQCVRCHGPADRHLASLAPMPKLSALTTEEISNLCGGCHRTWEDITTKGPYGPVNVRFQPYRLTNSKCYDAVDRRISCTACHNPHEQTVRNSAFYDAKCRACHAPGGKLRTCRVAARNCVSCHMPKVDLPGAHFSFADHLIRVVRAGEPYPR